MFAARACVAGVKATHRSTIAKSRTADLTSNLQNLRTYENETPFERADRGERRRGVDVEYGGGDRLRLLLAKSVGASEVKAVRRRPVLGLG